MTSHKENTADNILSSTQIERALAYHRRGWTIIALPYGQKRPNRSNWQFEQHDEGELRRLFGNGPRNFGIRLGPASGNLVDADQDHPQWARLADRFLPPTGSRFGRPSKPNSHRLYRCDPLPASEKFSDPIPEREGGMGTIGELRAAPNLQTVLPDSLHGESGEPIRWEEDGEPATVDGPTLRERYACGCAAVLLAHHWPGPHRRHEPALALAGGLLRADWDEERVGELLEFLWPSAEPGQIEGVVRLTARKLAEGEAVTGWPRLTEFVNPAVVKQFKRWVGIRDAASSHELTDFGNAERFVAQHGASVLFCATWDKWLVWDGARWKIDELGTVQEWGKQTIRAIPDEARELPVGDDRKRILRWAIDSQQGRRLDTMLRRASSVEGIAVAPADFDSDRWLLNVANGTIDLRTMELREHRREERITKVMPVAYLSEAECPRWLEFVRWAMRGNENLVGYLRRLIGYCLTGDIGEKMLPILWGSGDNGKTTFTETVLALFGGDYGMTTPESTIAAKRNNDSIPNDVARLRAARLVAVSETTEGLLLNEGRIKALTGRNAVPARFLHAEWFEYVPEYTVFIETNHRPQIKGTDNAIWNRLKLIPFTNVVPKAEQDKELPTKLRQELPGILNWALAGCAEWQAGGLQEPAEVRAATDEYRVQSDILGEFLSEACIVEEGARERSSALYSTYKHYIEARGQRPLGEQRFADAMRERGFVKKSKHGYPYWTGVKCRPEEIVFTPTTRAIAVAMNPPLVDQWPGE